MGAIYMLMDYMINIMLTKDPIKCQFKYEARFLYLENIVIEFQGQLLLILLKKKEKLSSLVPFKCKCIFIINYYCLNYLWKFFG